MNPHGGGAQAKAALAPDLTALGNWKERSDVLKALEPIVRKVQEPMGYACYSQYEEAVRSVIDRTQQSIAAEMEANRHDSAKVLTKVACDLNLMLASTSICKAMRNGKHDWNAQRMMILHTNKWTGGPDVAASSFAERASNR